MIEDRASTGVKPAERYGSEVDGPDVVGDLLESNVLAAEQMRDENAHARPADAAVRGDLPDLEVSWILGVLELGRERTGRKSIDGGRGRCPWASWGRTSLKSERNRLNRRC